MITRPTLIVLLLALRGGAPVLGAWRDEGREWLDEGRVLSVPFDTPSLRAACEADLRALPSKRAVRIQYFSSKNSALPRVRWMITETVKWVEQWRASITELGSYGECWKIGNGFGVRTWLPGATGIYEANEPAISGTLPFPGELVLMQISRETYGSATYSATFYVKTGEPLSVELGLDIWHRLRRLLPRAAIVLMMRRDRWFMADPLFPWEFPFFGPGFPPGRDPRLTSSTVICITDRSGTPAYRVE